MPFPRLQVGAGITHHRRASHGVCGVAMSLSRGSRWTSAKNRGEGGGGGGCPPTCFGVGPQTGNSHPFCGGCSSPGLWTLYSTSWHMKGETSWEMSGDTPQFGAKVLTDCYCEIVNSVLLACKSREINYMPLRICPSYKCRKTRGCQPICYRKAGLEPGGQKRNYMPI